MAIIIITGIAGTEAIIIITLTIMELEATLIQVIPMLTIHTMVDEQTTIVEPEEIIMMEPEQ